MARIPRIQFEGAVYHIYPRGNRRERIAHADADYRTLERYFVEAAIKMEVRPRCWYPMPNHFHAVVETPRANISAFMQAWLSRYARYYNRAYSKIGHLFQRRFGSRLVEGDAYLKELIRYVDLQRHRSKHPDRIDPYCDRYASHRFYMGETCPPAVRKWIEPMLVLFGQTIEQARKNYAAFLADGLKDGTWQNFYKPIHGILGTEAYVKAMAERSQKAELAITGPLPPWRRQEAVSALLQAAAAVFEEDITAITGPSQRRSLCRARQTVASVGRKMGLRVTELAKVLRKGHPAISAMIAASEKRPASESGAVEVEAGARLSLNL